MPIEKYACFVCYIEIKFAFSFKKKIMGWCSASTYIQITQKNFSSFRLFSLQNDQSFMTFEGQQLQGAAKIMEKLQVN